MWALDLVTPAERPALALLWWLTNEGGAAHRARGSRSPSQNRAATHHGQTPRAGAIVGALWLTKRRTALREEFGIPGSALGDFALWWCCPQCALCQVGGCRVSVRVGG